MEVVLIWFVVLAQIVKTPGGFPRLIPATLKNCQNPAGAANRILAEACSILPGGFVGWNKLFPSRHFGVVLKCLAI